MAADEIMDYLENGNITNSVNMPACSLGPRKGARVSIIAKAGSSISETVASIAKGDMISKTKGDYTYTLADIGDDTDDAASIGVIGDDILRVRIIK